VIVITTSLTFVAFANASTRVAKIRSPSPPPRARSSDQSGVSAARLERQAHYLDGRTKMLLSQWVHADLALDIICGSLLRGLAQIKMGARQLASPTRLTSPAEKPRLADSALEEDGFEPDRGCRFGARAMMDRQGLCWVFVRLAAGGRRIRTVGSP
jgi:hypothetical protein